MTYLRAYRDEEASAGQAYSNAASLFLNEPDLLASFARFCPGDDEEAEEEVVTTPDQKRRRKATPKTPAAPRKAKRVL